MISGINTVRHRALPGHYAVEIPVKPTRGRGSFRRNSDDLVVFYVEYDCPIMMLSRSDRAGRDLLAPSEPPNIHPLTCENPEAIYRRREAASHKPRVASRIDAILFTKYLQNIP